MNCILVNGRKMMTSSQMVSMCPLIFPFSSSLPLICSVMFLQFVPKTHLFFTAGKDRRIKQWDADKFEHIQTLEVRSSNKVDHSQYAYFRMFLGAQGEILSTAKPVIKIEHRQMSIALYRQKSVFL